MSNRKSIELYEKAKKFAIEEIQPNLDRYEENPSQREWFTKLVETGYCGLNSTSVVGGKNLSYFDIAGIYEGLAHGSPEASFGLQLQNNIALLIERLSDDEEIIEIVKELVEGKKIVGYAFSESTCGSDPMSTTSLITEEEDCYCVNGTKDWIANAVFSDYFILIAKDGQPKSMKMLLVDRNSAGITIDDEKSISCSKLLGTARIRFDQVKVPKNRLLSLRGFQEALASIDVARVYVPAICVGLAQRSLDLTAEFLAGRISMGKPILHSEGIQWKLAELTAKVSAARQLVYHTAELMDQKDPELSYIAAQSKLFAPKVAVEVTTECVQYFGALGLLDSNMVNRCYKIAKMFDIVDGSGEIQKIIIGRKIVKNNSMRE